MSVTQLFFHLIQEQIKRTHTKKKKANFQNAEYCQQYKTNSFLFDLNISKVAAKVTQLLIVKSLEKACTDHKTVQLAFFFLSCISISFILHFLYVTFISTCYSINQILFL